jgi:hypothetical protein
MSTLEKLPTDIVLTRKERSTAVLFIVPNEKDPDRPHFAVSIDAESEEKATDFLLSTLKANDIGYDEVTRTTKWQ